MTREELDEAGLKYLDRFDVTVAGLKRMFRRYLMRAHAKDRDVSAADPMVDELIRRYCEAGILSDQRFASNMAAGLRRRGASRLGIVHKLRGRGVNGDLAKDAVREVDAESNDAELEAAKALVRRRRLGPYRAKEERALRAAKDLGVLARAGFSFEIARRALGSELDEPD